MTALVRCLTFRGMTRRRLKEAREARGLTQFELAVRAGTRPNVLQRIETGRGLPAWETGLRIARELGYDVTALEALFSEVES